MGNHGGTSRGGQINALAIAWLIQTVTGLTILSFGPLAPFLQADLDLTNTQVGFLASAVFLTSFVLLIPIGSLVDRIGAKRGMVIGQATLGVLMASAYLAPSYLTLVLLITLAGVGTNFTLPSTTRAILTWFSVRSRATAMSIKQTGYNAGGLIAALALPVIALAGGFRLAFLAIGGFALFSSSISLLRYTDPPTAPGKRPPRVPFRETLAFLTNKDVLTFAFAIAAFNMMQTSLLTHIVLYLNNVILLPVLIAGSYLAVIQVSGIVGRIGWGLISDRVFGGRRLEVLLIMSAGAILSTVAIALLSAETPALILFIVMAFTGLLFLGWPGIYLTLAGEIGGQREAGGTVGVVATLANVGVLVGPPTFGYLVDATGSYIPAWGFLAAVMAIGFAALLALRSRGHIDHTL